MTGRGRARGRGAPTQSQPGSQGETRPPQGRGRGVHASSSASSALSQAPSSTPVQSAGDRQGTQSRPSSAQQIGNGQPSHLIANGGPRHPAQQNGAPGGPRHLAQQIRNAAPGHRQPPPKTGAGRAAFRGGNVESGGAGDMGELVQHVERVQIGRLPRDPNKFEFLKSLRYLDYDDVRTRPAHIGDKKGITGEAVMLKANYFALNTKPDYNLYQYHVDFNPPVESKRVKMALLDVHSELLGRKRAFDGMILYTPRYLEDKTTEVYSQRETDDAKIRITITRTAEVPTTSPQFVQVANIQFRKALAMVGLKQIGRHYFDVENRADLPNHKLAVMPGFVSSVLPHEDQLLLGLDVAHKVLRFETVLDVMQTIYRENRRMEDFKQRVVKEIMGSIVLTRYNNRTYQVDDIDFEAKPTDSFTLSGKDKTSYVDYYKKQYGIVIKDMDQPLLVSRPKARDIRGGKSENVYLIPELCTLTGLTDTHRADFSLMRDVASHTRVKPAERVQRMLAFRQRLEEKPEVSQLFKGWELVFSKELVKVKGRVLPQENIAMLRAGSNVHVNLGYRREEMEWSREMRGKHMITGVPLTKWLVICLQFNMQLAEQLVNALISVGPPMNMHISRPTFVQPSRDSNEEFKKAIYEYVKPGVQMAVVVVPNQRKDRYDAIKKCTCLEVPVPSQVVQSRTLQKSKMLLSVATKIAIQINCKLGGEPWICDMPVRDTMMIGIDSYHDSSMKNRSVVGFVASTNSNQTRFWVDCSFQNKHEELANCLTRMIRVAVEKYVEINNKPPLRYMVYRDGVGDGQLRVVFEHEMPQVRDALRTMFGTSEEPKMDWIIVKKRIMARIFSHSNNDNPRPGTVVDTTITNNMWYDFFLISQSVKQGTVSPTHYNCIWSTSRLSPDQLQRLTYKLTHLYYNWPGTIRVPALCQYAHKLAFLVGQSLHAPPDLSLCNRLFFL